MSSGIVQINIYNKFMEVDEIVGIVICSERVKGTLQVISNDFKCTLVSGEHCTLNMDNGFKVYERYILSYDVYPHCTLLKFKRLSHS